MKIYALYLYKKTGNKTTLINTAHDFNDVGWMYRKNCLEIADWTSKQIAESPNPEVNVTVDEKNFHFHARRKNNICAIIISTKDYPSRAAFNILREIIREYDLCGGNLPNNKCQTIQRGITEYQDPSQADKLMKIQSNLDETERIMNMNIQKALVRRESLEEMAQKSKELSEQSKVFVRESSKLNSCCLVI